LTTWKVAKFTLLPQGDTLGAQGNHEMAKKPLKARGTLKPSKPITAKKAAPPKKTARQRRKKSPTATTLQIRPSTISVPPTEAQAELRNALAVGQGLWDKAIRSWDEFSVAQDDANTWEEQCRNMLRNLTNNESLRIIFDDEPPPPGMQGRDLALDDEIADLRRRIGGRIDKLSDIARTVSRLPYSAPGPA
jgi:hypothetical protein